MGRRTASGPRSARWKRTAETRLAAVHQAPSRVSQIQRNRLIPASSAIIDAKSMAASALARKGRNSMSRLDRCWFFAGLTVLLLCMAGPAVAQLQTGDLYGTVVGEDGAALPGVT